jgi:hypothetical protein
MLYYNTVNDLLKNTLITLMESSVFESFRLVGGTALSLQLGHRLSVDIDLFSDAPYGSIDFKAIDEFIEKTFPHHYHFSNLDPAMGKSYSVGTDKDNVVKLDVFFTKFNFWISYLRTRHSGAIVFIIMSSKQVFMEVS